jgi:hypothetical protein
VVGPPGVFLLDTKRLLRPAFAADHALRAVAPASTAAGQKDTPTQSVQLRKQLHAATTARRIDVG